MTLYNEFREASKPKLREEAKRLLPQRDTLVLLILVVALLLWGLLFAGCGRNVAAMPDPDKPVPVTVVEAKVEPHAKLHRVSGLAIADEEAMLAFKTGGIVARMDAEVGDRFKRGDLLAMLDTTEVAAMLTDAEQTWLVASNDYERIKRLHDTKVITDQQFEAARAGKERAEAGLRRARFNLDHSTIRAPFDGSVNMKLANRGEIVGPGQPVFRVLNHDAGGLLQVRVSAPAILTSSLREGQEVELEIEGVVGIHRGALRSVSRSAEPGTGGFPVEVRLPNLPGLNPGLVVTVSLPGRPEPMIALPAISLTNMDEDRGYVYLVEEGRAARWPVTIRMIAGDVILIEPTLPESSVVIERGAGYVSDGRFVTIREEQP